MNSLERTLITKTGYDHGWEVVVEDTPDQVVLASALHRARAYVGRRLPDSRWLLLSVHPDQLHRELQRAIPESCLTDDLFGASNEAALGHLLAHASRIARALPDAPELRFALAVKRELESEATTTTEVERLVRQRVGQDIYRESLFDYWGGACAVTGITVPELLRASHTKAWSKCDSDAERLNVFNGFLLVAHLDALFDRYLMTFDESGAAVFAPAIDTALRAQLGLGCEPRLRWVRPEHQHFLWWHRDRFSCTGPHKGK
jgi:hypothetical protein